MTMAGQHSEICGSRSVGPDGAPETSRATDTSGSDARKLRCRSLTEVRIVPTRYLWTGYLPVAELAMLVGKPGVGKSTLAADVAARLTTGHLNGTFLGQRRNVLYSLTEDSPSTFKARFLAAGGDPERLTVLDVVQGALDGSPLLVEVDLEQLRLAILERQPALVVLDALNSSLEGQQNDNSNVRPQLEKLKGLAQQTKAAILGIGHFRKSTTGSEPLDSIGGAGAYGQVIRQALGSARDEDGGTCTLSVIKSNGQGLDVPSLAYRIDEALIPSDEGGNASVGRVTWLGESDTSVRDLLQRTPQDDGDRGEREQAADWLVDYLKFNGGEAPARDVFRAGHFEGYSRDSLKRAKGRIVRSEKAGFGSGWVWRLSTDGIEGSAKGAKSAAVVGPLSSRSSVLPSGTDRSPEESPGVESTARIVTPLRPASGALRDCGHPAQVRAENGKCALCITAKHRAVATCSSCQQPIDPAAGDIHPGCGVA